MNSDEVIRLVRELHASSERAPGRGAPMRLVRQDAFDALLLYCGEYNNVVKETKFRVCTKTGKQFVAATLEECAQGIAETTGVKDPVLYTCSNGTALVYASKELLQQDCAANLEDINMEAWVAMVCEEKS